MENDREVERNKKSQEEEEEEEIDFWAGHVRLKYTYQAGIFYRVSVGIGGLQGSRGKGGCCGSDRAICR
ncbi:hypothetical protein PBY51_008975 [Eleginops maclovinus]|uniref:Uncharacterized protein n=1 Tax=Eleginops maclovinus TaxID=56733 RepID=A0AAN7WY59_ELEMC|nr:hypothetical protein PBY51_008975 [Eleginops maclovinus]